MTTESVLLAPELGHQLDPPPRDHIDGDGARDRTERTTTTRVSYGSGTDVPGSTVPAGSSGANGGHRRDRRHRAGGDRANRPAGPPVADALSKRSEGRPHRGSSSGPVIGAKRRGLCRGVARPNHEPAPFPKASHTRDTATAGFRADRRRNYQVSSSSRSSARSDALSGLTAWPVSAARCNRKWVFRNADDRPVATLPQAAVFAIDVLAADDVRGRPWASLADQLSSPPVTAPGPTNADLGISP